MSVGSSQRTEYPARDALLQVEQLRVQHQTDARITQAVDDIISYLDRGETLGICRLYASL